MSNKQQALEEGRIRLKYKVSNLEQQLQQAKSELKKTEALIKQQPKPRMYRGRQH